MRYNGQPLSQETIHIFSLPRVNGKGVIFQLSPLPLGFHQRLRERGILPPAPPTKVARDSTGKPQRDQSGVALLVADSHNTQYLNNAELYHQRVAVLSIVEALRTDTQIEFETPDPATNDWATYADCIFKELEQAGLSAGDLILLCQEICRISNLIDQHLPQAQANFSSTHQPNST